MTKKTTAKKIVIDTSNSDKLVRTLSVNQVSVVPINLKFEAINLKELKIDVKQLGLVDTEEFSQITILNIIYENGFVAGVTLLTKSNILKILRCAGEGYDEAVAVFLDNFKKYEEPVSVSFIKDLANEEAHKKGK